jgi:hypothetical protein
MSKLNIELLKRLRTRFLRMRHPEHFNMKPIAAKTDCGTAMCIAGHTLSLAGYKMRLQPDTDSERMYEGKLDYDFISPRGRKVEDPLVAASRELGMKPTFSHGSQKRGAYTLFHDFSLKTPKQAAERIQKIIETGEVS